MQAYLTFIDKIDKLIESVSSETKFLLALDISKKLYPDYLSFATKTGFGDSAVLEEALTFSETSFKNLESDSPLLNELIEKVVAVTPDNEDFSSWEITYAANASQAVYELLLYLKDSKNKHISDICSLMIDTTDFKIAAANEHLSDEGIFKHPQMLETMNEILQKLK